MHLEIAQSTPSASAMAGVVQAHYGLGEVFDFDGTGPGYLAYELAVYA